jgi:hypothetical protein
MRGFHDNGHGVSATPDNVSRCRHSRFPHPGPLPEGEGDLERASRDFHGNHSRERSLISPYSFPSAAATLEMSVDLPLDVEVRCR